MLKNVIKIFSAIVIFFLMAGIAALLWASHYVDSPQFRKDIFSGLSKVAGREVILLGELDVTVYPWLGLRAHDVTMANEPGFGDDPLLRCREISLGVRLLPLFLKKLVVRDILMDGMRINLIRSQESEVNWDDYASSKDAPTTPFFSFFKSVFIQGITVKDAMILFENGHESEGFQLHGLSAHIGAFSPGEGAGFQLSGSFNREKDSLQATAKLSGILDTGFLSETIVDEVSLEVEAQGGSLPKGEKVRFFSNLGYNRDEKTVDLSSMHFRALEADANGDAQIENILNDWHVSGHLRTESFSPVAVLGKWKTNMLFQEQKVLQHAKAAFSFDANATRFRMSDLNAVIDDSRITGAIQIANLSNPHTSFNLAVNSLDLDRYRGHSEGKEPIVWNDVFLPVWKKMNMSGTLDVQEFTLFGEPYGNTQFELNARRGKISALARGGAFGGLLSAALDVEVGDDPENPPLRASFKGDITSAKFDSLNLLETEWGELDGPVNAHLEFQMNHPSCPPAGRVQDSLKNVRMSSRIHSPSTLLKIRSNRAQLAFDDVRLEIEAVPQEKADGYGFLIESSAYLNESKSSRSASFSYDGSLILSDDLATIASPKGTWSLRENGWLLPNDKEVLNIRGHASFPPGFRHVRMDDVSVDALGATLETSFVVKNPLDSERTIDGAATWNTINLKKVLPLYGVEVYTMADAEVFDSLGGNAGFRYADAILALSKLKARFDETDVSGRVNVTFEDSLGFDVALKLGIVNLDKYLTPDTETDLRKLRAGIDEDAPPVSMPLQTLKWLNVSGSLWIDKFILQDAVIEELSGGVFARNGEIRLTELAGKFYGGTVKGTWNGQVHEKYLETDIAMGLRGFEAGPMLKDLAGREYVRGTTNMDFALAARGATDDEIVAALEGNINFAIGSGSYKFTNWDATLTDEQREKGVRDLRTQRTVFSDVTSRWEIRKGYFAMKHFDLQSVLMRGSGSGGFSPSKKRIDLSFKADVAAVPSFTVRIVGHIKDPEVIVPKDKIVTNTLRNILNIPQKSFKFLRDLFF